MTMKTVILIACLVLASAAPKPTKLNFRDRFKLENKPSPRLLGGHLAEPHSIPYQAFLEFFKKTSAMFCGGTLISQNYVLTSYYCAESTLEVFVTLGAHLLYYSENTQINVYSTDIVANFDNDLGLVKLPNPVTFTDAIQPATLPTRADGTKDYSGEIGVMSGWGSDDEHIQRPFDVLRYINIEIDDDCPRDDAICTSGYYGDDKVGPCNSDDGGPLVVDGILVGVIRQDFFNYCLPGMIQLENVRIDRFFDWIQENSDVVFEFE